MPRPRSITSLVLTVMLLTATALGQGGLSLGASAGLQEGGFSGINLRAEYPVLHFMNAPLQAAVRADLGIGLGGAVAPALGVAVVLRGEPASAVSPYLGGGVGLSFAGSAGGTFASGYALTGLRFRLSGGLAAVVEGAVNLSGYGSVAVLSFGLDYVFGSVR